jgi:hypothetical protein
VGDAKRFAVVEAIAGNNGGVTCNFSTLLLVLTFLDLLVVGVGTSVELFSQHVTNKESPLVFVSAVGGDVDVDAVLPSSASEFQVQMLRRRNTRTEYIILTIK